MDIKKWEDKIKEKRKQTPWRDFVKEICSRRTFSFYKTDDLISIYPKNERINSIVTVKNFLENQDNLLGLGINHSGNFFNDFQKLFLSIPLSNVLLLGGCENSNYSDQSRNSKNAYLSYILANSENILYSLTVKDNSKNIFNSINVVNSENIYQCFNIALSYNIFYSKHIDNCNNLRFCTNMIGCNNCILSNQLENKSYCIYNKQYEKSQREINTKEIIKELQTQKKRGEFFDPEFSPFPYNDTVAMEYFPIKKEQLTILEPDNFISDAILNLGGEEKIKIKWRNGEKEINIPDGIKTIHSKDIQNNITEISDGILEKAIICEESGRPFRIVKAELDFYRKNGYSIPTRHPDIRHEERFNKRPGRSIFTRKCDKCGIEMISVHSKDSEFSVYCENCYNKEIYG